MEDNFMNVTGVGSMTVPRKRRTGKKKQKKKKTWKHNRRKRIGKRLQGAEEKEGK